jgi:hypothetical protein
MAITISGSGITSANIADGTIVNADVNDVAASKLTGALPAISGASLTGLTAAQMPNGTVVQVLQGQYSSAISTTSMNTWFTVTSQAITPQGSSNKVLCTAVVMGIQAGTNFNARLDVGLYRGSTQIHQSLANRWTISTLDIRDGGFSIQWLDSPSTTSPTTYYLKGRWQDGSTCLINKDSNAGYSTLTLQEIRA